MNEVATELLKDVVDAFEQRDVERARVVWGARRRTRRARRLGAPRPADAYDGRPESQRVGANRLRSSMKSLTGSGSRNEVQTRSTCWSPTSRELFPTGKSGLGA